MTQEEFKKYDKILPKLPGVYRYYDKDQKLLYVGKAKNLKSRVSSYFRSDILSARIQTLVRKISEIEFTIVNTELDALLLENNLIKIHQPKYNIRLRDDKTYSSICVKNEPFARVFPTRNIIKDGSKYYGPYASGRTMNTILEVIKKNFQLRNCSLNLSDKNIAMGKYKVCLEYQIGNCLGPCEGKQNEDDYSQNIEKINDLLKGNIGKVTRSLGEEMQEAASKYEFERAQKIKLKIEALQFYQSKSVVASTDMNEVDVFSYAKKEDLFVINYLKVNHGSVVISHNLELKNRLEETDSDMLLYGLIELRQKFGSQAKEVLTPIEIDLTQDEFKVIVPKIGDKKKLLEISHKNAFYAMSDILKQIELKNPQLKTETLLEKMRKDLNMSHLPKHIECFDNSNIQGNFPVSAMVVFKDGKPSKKDYRHYNIKTVIGPNDFASMEEVVYRRYKRVLDENQPLPNLIVIDGGKGQLSSAVSSLQKLDIASKVTIVGIAKNLEELFFPNDPYPLHIDKNSITLKVIQRLRDEAHRFGITHHRNKRSKETIKTQLSDIKGLGPKTIAILLKTFGSIERIKQQNFLEISSHIGKAKTQILFDFYQINS